MYKVKHNKTAAAQLHAVFPSDFGVSVMFCISLLNFKYAYVCVCAFEKAHNRPGNLLVHMPHVPESDWR